MRGKMDNNNISYKNVERSQKRIYVHKQYSLQCFEGRTSFGGEHYNKFGIYHSWISRWNDKVKGEYPEQIIYYDNLFRTNKKREIIETYSRLLRD